MGDALDTVILRPSQDWLQDSYAAAMPSFPNIPIYDTDTWLAQWFDADIFGIEHSLDAPLQLPELPSVPTYQFGANLPILDGYISEK
jgi:hypothetical protein